MEHIEDNVSASHTEHFEDSGTTNVQEAHVHIVDVDVEVYGVRIIVCDDCQTVNIEGKSRKISFSVPTITSGADADSDGHSHGDEPSESHHHDTNTTTEDIEDIVVEMDGVVITLCECCTILKIEAKDTKLSFPLNSFKKNHEILTEDENYYIRSYKIQLYKNKTNERDQKLVINNKEIPVSYSPANKMFSTHLFFQNYTNLLNLLADYLKTYPDLVDIKVHKH